MPDRRDPRAEAQREREGDAAPPDEADAVVERPAGRERAAGPVLAASPVVPAANAIVSAARGLIELPRRSGAGVPREPTIAELAPSASALAMPRRVTEAELRVTPSVPSGPVDVETPGYQSPRASRAGRFEPRTELGAGGMGRVVEALDTELGRVVAVKLIRDQSSLNPMMVSRFLNEARLTAQLDHPNIVPVHEIGLTAEGELFFVMKRVYGRSMRDLIDALLTGDQQSRPQWNLHRRLGDFVQVCNAIAYAHDHGVLHRDLKPDNVMIGSFGEVLVMDWGVARYVNQVEPSWTSAVNAVAPQPGNTLEGTTVGTPGYMSPEQVLGNEHRLNPKADVWSLGAILYELLTLQPIFEGSVPQQIMMATLSTPPPDPRRRDPRLPPELATLCTRTHAHDPDARPSANELAQAVRAYLEGSARREEAELRVDEARQAWDAHAKLLEERERVQDLLQRAEASTPPWLALERKRELLELRAVLQGFNARLEENVEKVVSSCERALSHDPENGTAHDLLAEVYWLRLHDADLRGDAIAARHYANRVRAHDGGRYIGMLDGDGAISLSTRPEGAAVYCQRIERSGLVWMLQEKYFLGHTPLVRTDLPMGSYLLTLEAEGYRTTLYPAHIFRGRHWEAGQAPLQLYREEEVGAGWIYVPAGPFVFGGDPQASDANRRAEPWVGGFFIAELPVTCGQYCDFLSELHLVDPEAAYRRVPREVSGAKSALGQYWERPAPGARYRVPEADRDGVRWDPDWPVSSVSWDDAHAYAAWCNQRLGASHRLPRELEWEKAARGVDGRAFPWGDEFDASLCLMRDSRPVNVNPDVVGAFPFDCSVYGVRDMAGGVAEWCVESSYLGDTRRRIARGGSFMFEARASRVASRKIVDVAYVYPSIGFRLVRGGPLNS